MLASGADPRAGQSFLPTARTSAHFANRIFFLPGTSFPSGKHLAQLELGSGLGGLTPKRPHPKLAQVIKVWVIFHAGIGCKAYQFSLLFVPMTPAGGFLASV